jgi:sigma-B regulation protein RsbU (phosphoserine phosphatase)
VASDRARRTRGAGDQTALSMWEKDSGRRAAEVLEQALSEADSARLARTLLSSLLPEALPSLSRLALSSLYHPAGKSEVGGDFYDVFTTPAGCWLVVGDVCGKGAEAAVVTAMVRHSVRALAFVDCSPARVLGTVNEVLLGHSLSYRFATVVLVLLELERSPVVATIAAAGHPPPLLLAANGRVSCPSLPGMFLGVRSGSNVRDVELELDRGSTLVLYTDGLLDAGAPRCGLTPDELCERVSEHADMAPEPLVRRLEQLALSSGAGRLRDDVAIVAARLHDDLGGFARAEVGGQREIDDLPEHGG